MNRRIWIDRRSFSGMAAVVLASPRAAFASGNSDTFKLAVLIRPGQETDLKEPRARYWLTWFDELRQLGYAEGRNMDLKVLVADPSAFSETLGGLSAFSPDVIFVPAQSVVTRLKEAGVSTPIVTIVVDPVGYGFAESLARPGGNITGFTLDAGLELVAKRVAILRDVVPSVAKLAILILRPYWEGRWSGLYDEVGKQIGIGIIGAPFESKMSEKDFERIFSEMAEAGCDSLYVTPAPETLAHRRLIADLAIRSRLPSVNLFREYVEAGGLLGYGPDIVDAYRRAAGYLDLIFKGADPAGMPFQQPTKFDFTVNLKTATALGITVPPSQLALADEVFE